MQIWHFDSELQASCFRNAGLNACVYIFFKKKKILKMQFEEEYMLVRFIHQTALSTWK